MVTAVVASLRPRQWIKNLFVLAGLIFAQRLFTSDVWAALGAFAIFCALSGAVYIVNDLSDLARDRAHPVKRARPIAAGRLGVGPALAVAVVLGGAGLVCSAGFGRGFLATAMAYVVLVIAYSTWLKHVVIVDVLAVSSGYVLRAMAGALAIRVEISGWLLICTILLALFLTLGKRRHEVMTLETDATAQRPILAEYSQALLDQMIAVVTASTVTAYALYTMSPETVAKFHTHLLPATLPFVLYGIFRYLYLLYQRRLGGNPSEILLTDRALLLNSVAWLVAVLLIIYGLSLE